MSRFLRVLGMLLLITASPAATAGAAEPGTPASDALAEIEQAFGFVPSMITALPEAAIPGAWEALRDLEFNPGTAIPSKYKSLISMAVAAQIPCHYCLYIDTESARLAGATDAEIAEALGMAAITRQWSTVLNGARADMAAFEADVAGMLEFAASQPDGGGAASGPVTDAASAYQDMERTLGRVPGFMRAFPEVAIAGAWKEFKMLQLNPATAIPGKYKELIGLAVAAQIPCTYCIDAHTAFAEANGATEDELTEAVGIAALVRHWSTVVNGSQQSLDSFKAEADRMLTAAAAAAAASSD